MQYLDIITKMTESSLFVYKLFKITLIQVYARTNNAEEAEVEWFYDDLQDLLELTHTHTHTHTHTKMSFSSEETGMQK